MPPFCSSGISKHFGPVHALDRVDFAVNAGEVVGLVGDNGAGKSTLVKTITRMDQPRRGQDLVRGPRRCRSANPRTRRAWGSRPSTRTWRCATTSTSSPTCSSGARKPRGVGAGGRQLGRGRDGEPRRGASLEPRGDDPRPPSARWGRSLAVSASRWRSPARCSANRKS